MTKGRHTATCALFSHQFGWELPLTIGELLRPSRKRELEREMPNLIREYVDVVAPKWTRAQDEAITPDLRRHKVGTNKAPKPQLNAKGYRLRIAKTGAPVMELDPSRDQQQLSNRTDAIRRYIRLRH